MVVTASHNPPADNGYKVYDSNSAQIIPPLDSASPTPSHRVGPCRRRAHARARRVDATPGGADPRRHSERLHRRGDGGPHLAGRATRNPSSTRRFTGWRASLTRRALTEAGHTRHRHRARAGDARWALPHGEVPQPRGDRVPSISRSPWPTEQGADLILANDPDGDRLAVAVPAGDGGGSSPATRSGCSMADHILQHARREPGPPAHGARRAWFPHHCSGDRRRPRCPLGADAHRVQVDLERGAGAPGRRGGVASSSGSRRRSATRWVRWCATRTACRPRWCSPTSPPGRLLRADRCGTSWRALAARHGLWVSAQHLSPGQAPEGPSEIGGAVDRVAASPPPVLGGMTVTDVSDLRTGGESASDRGCPTTILVELRFGTEGQDPRTTVGDRAEAEDLCRLAARSPLRSLHRSGRRREGQGGCDRGAVGRRTRFVSWTR